MYQSTATNQRMKIGVSLRRALILSLAAHVFLFVWTRNESVFDGGGPEQLIAVTISAKPPLNPSRTLPLASPSPIVVSQSDTVHVPAAEQRHDVAAKPKQEEPAIAVKMPSDALLPNRAPAPNAEGLRGYRLALAREARRAWLYPKQALDEQWQGTTDIRIELLSGGRMLAARVEKSSGYAVLDEAALLLMSNAANSAQVPTSLISESLSIVVPVKFSLAGEH